MGNLARSTSEEQRIRDLVDTWLSATRSKDITKVLSLISDDVIFMVPGRKPFGKNAFAATATEMKDVEIDGTSEIQDLYVIDSWAWMRTRLNITIKPRNGAPQHQQGYTLTVLRKDSRGEWTIYRDANLLTPVAA